MDNAPNKKEEDPYHPGIGFRLVILLIGGVVVPTVCLGLSGSVGIGLVFMAFVGGWIVLGKDLGLFVFVFPTALIFSGIYLYFAARSMSRWVLGCILLALAFLLPLGGCVMMGKFIDG